MSDDPLDIPPFLRREGNPKSAPGPRPAPDREWVMPPIALAAVARAVRAGCDTMQKIRKRTRNHYNNHEIRQALRPANPALARHPSKQPPTGIHQS